MTHSSTTLIRHSPSRYPAEAIPGRRVAAPRAASDFPPLQDFRPGDEVPSSKPIPLIGVIIKLLDRAAEAVDSDLSTAKDCIARAASLLEAEHGGVDATRQDTAAGFARGGLTPWQMRHVTKHIDTAMASSISTDECAAIARLSKSHFRRAFKASFGETFYAYLNRRRIDRAQEMIVTTDEPLSQIARLCGFVDQSHFTRVFRRAAGQNPGTWRRQYAATGGGRRRVLGRAANPAL